MALTGRRCPPPTSDESAGEGSFTFVKEDPPLTFHFQYVTAYACPLDPPSPSPTPATGGSHSHTVPVWAIGVMAAQGAVIACLVGIVAVAGFLYLRIKRRSLYTHINS